MASLNPTRPKTEPLSPVSAKEPVKPTPMVTSTGAGQQPVKRSPAPPPPAGLTQTPPFLTKLYNLVEDSLTNELVSWTENGALSAQSFTVHKPDEFGRDVLPRYFKHNNFSSFVRQLNQYGFHKKDPDRWTFGHDNFRRGRLDLLRLISRRRPKPQPPQAPPPTTPPSRSAPPPQQAVVELGSYGLAGKLDGLKRDKDVLIKELVITRKAEKKLQEKCENLELRVDMLENSTKQMQNFIMHYFSQVLQPYSDEIASRKRKRLPPAPTLDVLDLNGAEKSGPTVGAVSADAAKTIAPPFAPSGLPNPSGVSLEALRQMMQQMQMSQTAPTAPASVAETSARFVAAAPHTPSPKFAPATVQELPLDENGLNGGDATMRAASPPPAASPPLKAAKPKPNGRANPKLSEASATANALSALEDVLMKSATEPSPREGFLNFQDTDGMREQGFAFAKEEDQLPSWNDKFLHGTDGADKIASNSKSGVAVQQDRKTETVEAIDEFMDLHDDIDLLPPLTELPEGTDISALVRHIQGFGDQVDGL